MKKKKAIFAVKQNSQRFTETFSNHSTFPQGTRAREKEGKNRKKEKKKKKEIGKRKKSVLEAETAPRQSEKKLKFLKKKTEMKKNLRELTGGGSGSRGGWPSSSALSTGFLSATEPYVIYIVPCMLFIVP